MATYASFAYTEAVALQSPSQADYRTDSVNPSDLDHISRKQAPTELHTLTDSALEAHIHTVGLAFVEAHRRYQASGCFADAGDRDRLWVEQREALIERGCRPNIVTRMERERGLA